ncbi:MAG: hypothetical protein HYY96_15425 [Candidatus Tectomicrobia bacterium]|nr:hypothetical protein [Candidatus Tectomicrobia bacterium]
MEQVVFELAGGKYSVRETYWNDETKALFRIINEKEGRTEVSDFYVSAKRRRGKSTPLEELIGFLEKILNHSKSRDRQPFPTPGHEEGRAFTSR